MDRDADAWELENLKAELRRRPQAREPQKMGDVVNRLLAQRGYLQSLADEQLQQTWREAVGHETAQQTRVGRLRRGVLEIIVSHSTLVQELGFRQRQLLEQLNAGNTKKSIRQLRFRVGEIG